MRNGVVRVLTALVGIPLVVFLTYLGGWPFLALILVSALLAQAELYALMAKIGLAPLFVPGLALGTLVGIRSVVPVSVSLIAVAAAVLCVAVLLSRRSSSPLSSLSATMLGVVYPTLLLTTLIDIRSGTSATAGDSGAFWLTLSIFLLVWMSDTAAYYVGKSVGSHKLAPGISPGKTWEGSVGGALGAVGLSIVLSQTVLPILDWDHAVILGLICGVLGQLGDLAESRIKRLAGAKDSGTMLPGHGGILDRFDAMIVAAPVAHFYLVYAARVV